MRLLIDTQLLIWTTTRSAALPADARALMELPSSSLIFSAASIWEAAIKRSVRREEMPVPSRSLHRGLIASGFTELPVTGDHTILVENLPLHHRDPFDRILVAQALFEGIPLLTTDRALAPYPGDIRIV